METVSPTLNSLCICSGFPATLLRWAGLDQQLDFKDERSLRRCRSTGSWDHASPPSAWRRSLRSTYLGAQVAAPPPASFAWAALVASSSPTAAYILPVPRMCWPACYWQKWEDFTLSWNSVHRETVALGSYSWFMLLVVNSKAATGQYYPTNTHSSARTSISHQSAGQLETLSASSSLLWCSWIMDLKGLHPFSRLLAVELPSRSSG